MPNLYQRLPPAPPLWLPPRPRMLPSSGTLFTINLAGTVTSAGALIRQDSKALAGSIAQSGALAKQAQKPLAGTIASSGLLTRKPGKSVAGTIASAGVLTRQTGKSLAAVIASAGALTKQTGKALAGTIRPSVAAQFVATSSQYLGIADNASLSTGNIDFWVAAWAYLNTTGSGFDLVNKAGGSAGTDEWLLRIGAGGGAVANTPRLEINKAGTYQGINATTFGALSASTWYYLLAWHDSVADTINISVNGGPANSVATGGTGPADLAGMFAIGAYAATGNPFNGRLANVCFGKSPPGGIGALVATIRDALYNAGQGVNLAGVSGADRTAWGGVSAWPLGEGSGSRADVWGTNTLTDNNGVGAAVGFRGGLLTRQTGKALAGTITSAGLLSNVKVALLSVAGTIASSGALAKQAQKPLAGVMASGGVLTRQAGKALAGTVASSGLLTRKPGKGLTGTVSSSGVLSRQDQKLLAGTIASAGALAKKPGKAFAGTIASAGVLTRQAGKALTGAIASSGALSNIKVAILNVAGTIGSSGALSRQAQKGLGGTVPSSGVLTRQTSKSLAGMLASAGALARRPAKALAGTVGSTGALSNVKVALLTVAGTLASSGALTRTVGKGLGGTVAAGGALARTIGKTLAGVIGWVGSLVTSGGSLTAADRGSVVTSVVVVGAAVSSRVLVGAASGSAAGVGSLETEVV